jgi:hypothetical protein
MQSMCHQEENDGFWELRKFSLGFKRYTIQKIRHFSVIEIKSLMQYPTENTIE